MKTQGGKPLFFDLLHNKECKSVKAKAERCHFSCFLYHNKMWLVPNTVTLLSCQGFASTESCSPRVQFCKKKTLIKVTLMADGGAYDAPASSTGRHGTAASCGSSAGSIQVALSHCVNSSRQLLWKTPAPHYHALSRELEKGFNNQQCYLNKFKRKMGYFFSKVKQII